MQYYLYYDLEKYVFFLPTENTDYPELEVKNFDDLEKTENPNDDFLSTQFIKKVNQMMKNNELTFE